MSQLTLPFDAPEGATPPAPFSRERARAVAAETLAILDAGFYLNARGERVELTAAVERAVRVTAHFREGVTPAVAPFTPRATVIEVRNESTFAAAKRLEEAGMRTLALNFASAKSVGGGWRNGARAQEECLCRGSGLSRCLEANRQFYDFHRAMGGGFYSDWMMLSPLVPVFRDDEPGETLLETPWTTAFLTAAAPNAKAIHLKRERILPIFQARIEKVLAIALAENYDAVVLGAWGCGAFGNDPREVAPLFAAALTGPFRGAFARVAFAVLDPSQDERMIAPFRAAFGV